MMKVYWFNEL